MQFPASISVLKVSSFGDTHPSRNAHWRNVRMRKIVESGGGRSDGVEEGTPYTNHMSEGDVALGKIIHRIGKSTTEIRMEAHPRAGPRERCYFDPSTVVAGIVTCGGLCPGINNVIRELVHALEHLYGVNRIVGFRGGYHGICRNDAITLNASSVKDIHLKGGTVLGSARGGFDEGKMTDTLIAQGITQLYVIGGDGTMRGAQKLHSAVMRRFEAGDISHLLAVACVPKTIDNDIARIDRSFGFSTAVQEALRAIRSAKTEASCAPRGIGIVKLMGRHAGFIAVEASLASGDVDLVLVPEIPVVIDGPESCLDHVVRVVDSKGHAVVVVAEGAGEEILGKSAVVDSGGNRKLPPVGTWLKQQIERRHAELYPKDACSVKYIDPSYMIRSVAANASDSMFCLLLAQQTVHGVFAGYTGFCTGVVNNRTVYLPMDTLVKESPRMMRATGRTMERVLSLTGQPKVPIAAPEGELSENEPSLTFWSK